MFFALPHMLCPYALSAIAPGQAPTQQTPQDIGCHTSASAEPTDTRHQVPSAWPMDARTRSSLARKTPKPQSQKHHAAKQTISAIDHPGRPQPMPAKEKGAKFLFGNGNIVCSSRGYPEVNLSFTTLTTRYEAPWLCPPRAHLNPGCCFCRRKLQVQSRGYETAVWAERNSLIGI